MQHIKIIPKDGYLTVFFLLHYLLYFFIISPREKEI